MEPDENNNNTSLRVASFSCYLDTGKDNKAVPLSSSGRPPHLPVSIKFSKPDSLSYLNTDNFGFEVPGPIQDPTSAFTFSHQQIPKDGEISIFGADKYFNMDYHQTEPSKHHKHTNDDHGPPKLPNLVPNTTPSLHSVASSWNSQSALITNPQSQIRHKKGTGRKNIFAGFGCKGPCFDKDAIHIKPSRSGSGRITHHLANPGMDLAAKLDESRHSIEVFGSGTTSKGSSDIATNMERKLSMLTWDAIPKGKALPSSTLGSTTICDDMASEASSDLFEIENLSGSIHPILTSDNTSTIMSPTSHYAPSEASIQWSVVTASAADYSMVSDYEARLGEKNDMDIKMAKSRSGGGKGGILLGCKNQKAVDVAENVCHKSSEKGKNLSVPFGKSKDSRGRGKTIDIIKLPMRSFGNIGGLS